MESIAALVGFSFVSSVTPGPNNILLWASGAAFGVRRSMRHVAGTALGIGAMTLGVAAGIGALVAAVPEIAFVMKVAGSLYLVYLAAQIAGAGALEQRVVARPMGLVEAAAFQLINPKSWIFALGAVTTFRPAALPPAIGSAVIALTMMAVIVPTAVLWAAGGDVIGRLVGGRRAGRIVSFVLAALVIASIAAVWL